MNSRQALDVMLCDGEINNKKEKFLLAIYQR